MPRVLWLSTCLCHAACAGGAGSTPVPTPDSQGDVTVVPPDVELPAEEAFGARTYTVPAAAHWVGTGLYVEAGAAISADEVAGGWNVYPSKYPMSAAGTDATTVGGCAWGSLALNVGLVRGDSQCVGAGATLQADRAGLVFLAAADTKREDNSGEVTVQLTSTGAWIPEIPGAAAAGFDVAALSATQVELTGEHVSLVLPRDLVAEHRADATPTMALFDRWYESHQALSGGRVPYDGERIRLVPDDSVLEIGALMIAGNPIYFATEGLEGEVGERHILRSHTGDYDVWGFVHELAHDFSFIHEGRFQFGGLVEAWANIWTLWTLERVGPAQARPVGCDGVAAHKASGTYAGLEADPWVGLCMLMELADDDLEVYQRFFAKYLGTDLTTIPAANAPLQTRWAWLAAELSEAAGRDVSPVLRAYHVPI